MTSSVGLDCPLPGQVISYKCPLVFQLRLLQLITQRKGLADLLKILNDFFQADRW